MNEWNCLNNFMFQDLKWGTRNVLQSSVSQNRPSGCSDGGTRVLWLLFWIIVSGVVFLNSSRRKTFLKEPFCEQEVKEAAGGSWRFWSLQTFSWSQVRDVLRFSNKSRDVPSSSLEAQNKVGLLFCDWSCCRCFSWFLLSVELFFELKFDGNIKSLLRFCWFLLDVSVASLLIYWEKKTF